MNRNDLIPASVFHRSGLVSGDTYVHLSESGYPTAVYIKCEDRFEEYPWLSELFAIHIRGKRFDRDFNGNWRVHDVDWGHDDR